MRSLGIIASLVCSTLASAQVTCAEDQSVHLLIRTIRASSRIDSEPKQAVSLNNLMSETSTENEGIAVDQELLDLKPKLELLPFHSFRLIASKEQEISLKKRDLVLLPNSQTLAFRPIYMENKRVGMWINWRDKYGEEILNTRIHFDPNNPVITGTDTSPNSGLILAIQTERGEK